MKKYEISFGNGTAWLEKRIVECEEYEDETDALDRMVDVLEVEGSEGYFITWEQTAEEGGEYNSDEYIVAGNHCRILLHYGILDIKEV